MFQVIMTEIWNQTREDVSHAHSIIPHRIFPHSHKHIVPPPPDLFVLYRYKLYFKRTDKSDRSIFTLLPRIRITQLPSYFSKLGNSMYNLLFCLQLKAIMYFLLRIVVLVFQSRERSSSFPGLAPRVPVHTYSKALIASL